MKTTLLLAVCALLCLDGYGQTRGNLDQVKSVVDSMLVEVGIRELQKALIIDDNPNTTYTPKSDDPLAINCAQWAEQVTIVGTRNLELLKERERVIKFNADNTGGQDFGQRLARTNAAIKTTSEDLRFANTVFKGLEELLYQKYKDNPGFQIITEQEWKRRMKQKGYKVPKARHR